MATCSNRQHASRKQLKSSTDPLGRTVSPWVIRTGPLHHFWTRAQKLPRRTSRDLGVRSRRRGPRRFTAVNRDHSPTPPPPRTGLPFYRGKTHGGREALETAPGTAQTWQGHGTGRSSFYRGKSRRLSSGAAKWRQPMPVDPAEHMESDPVLPHPASSRDGAQPWCGQRARVVPRCPRRFGTPPVRNPLQSRVGERLLVLPR